MSRNQRRGGALGEIIRLQKKAVGLKYGGKISGTGEEKHYSCEACGEYLDRAIWCHRCGKAVEIEMEPGSSGEAQ